MDNTKTNFNIGTVREMEKKLKVSPVNFESMTNKEKEDYFEFISSLV